jgi:hypothetical protein
MVKLPRSSRMAIVAGLGTVALLGAVAQSASAAPTPTSRAAVQTASAPTTTPPQSTVPHKATPQPHSMSSADPNCVYEVVTTTEFLTDAGRRDITLQPGSLLYGPQSNVIGQTSAFLYSLDYQVNGWVWTGALYEQYCDP